MSKRRRIRRGGNIRERRARVPRKGGGKGKCRAKRIKEMRGRKKKI